MIGDDRSGGVDLLFGNEHEVAQLTGGATSATRSPHLGEGRRRWWSRAAPKARWRSQGGSRVEIRGGAGREGRRHDRRRRPVRCRLPRCALPRAATLRAASRPARSAAAEVISHFGARPRRTSRSSRAVNHVKRLAVYCGSAPGQRPAFADATRATAAAMVGRGIDLVYGGGRLGLMGLIADSVLGGGGESYGVIPRRWSISRSRTPA